MLSDNAMRKADMNKSMNVGIGDMEGRSFILGREGHIFISDPSVSKEHAEIKFIDGRIRLRDLNSTNGIYLVKNNKPVRFRESYVEPDQTVVIGTQRRTVQSLLAIIGVFTS